MKSFKKIVAILDVFTPDKPEWSPAEISNKTGINMPSTYRILSLLSNQNFLDRNKNTGLFSIGPYLYTLGSLYLQAATLTQAVEPVVQTINEITEETVSVGILQNTSVVMVMRQQARHHYRTALVVGSHLPAYTSAIGKALLSELNDKEIDKLFPEELKAMTPKSIGTRTLLKKELAQIRNSGIAIDIEGTYTDFEGVGSIIRNNDGEAIAAMSIGIFLVRTNEARCQVLSELIKLGSDLASYRLGYKKILSPRTIEELISWCNEHKVSYPTEGANN